MVHIKAYVNLKFNSEITLKPVNWNTDISEHVLNL